MTPEERVRIRRLGVVEVCYGNQWHNVRSPIYSGVLAENIRRCIAEAVAEERLNALRSVDLMCKQIIEESQQGHVVINDAGIMQDMANRILAAIHGVGPREYAPSEVPNV